MTRHTGGPSATALVVPSFGCRHKGGNALRLAVLYSLWRLVDAADLS